MLKQSPEEIHKGIWDNLLNASKRESSSGIFQEIQVGIYEVIDSPNTHKIPEGISRMKSLEESPDGTAGGTSAKHTSVVTQKKNHKMLCESLLKVAA